MKRVVYLRALSPIVVGQSATVIPLNHPDTENVQNCHPCYTTEVRRIYSDGTTFETKNTQYRLVETPPLGEVLDEVKEMEQ
jgi:hypothetical protein